MTNLCYNEGKEMTKLFYNKIKVKNTKVDALFDFDSLSNMISKDLISKL